MGMAASQARLLTLTARLADNELRSQTINNAKMRLAAMSSKASEDYLNALNNAQYMFSSTDIYGASQTAALNFNALSAYSPYNTQYGLVNSSGLLLVGEKDAANFKAANGDLNKFLEAYGLNWDTTFFNNETYGDGKSTEIAQNLANVYSGTELENLFKTKENGYYTNDKLKSMYEKAQSMQSSLELMNYEKYATEYYNQYRQLYNEGKKAWLSEILGGAKTVNEFATNYIKANNITTLTALTTHLTAKGSETTESYSSIIGLKKTSNGGVKPYFEIETMTNTITTYTSAPKMSIYNTNVGQRGAGAYLTNEGREILEKMVNTASTAGFNFGVSDIDKITYNYTAIQSIYVPFLDTYKTTTVEGSYTKTYEDYMNSNFAPTTTIEVTNITGTYAEDTGSYLGIYSGQQGYRIIEGEKTTTENTTTTTWVMTLPLTSTSSESKFEETPWTSIVLSGFDPTNAEAHTTPTGDVYYTLKSNAFKNINVDLTSMKQSSYSTDVTSDNTGEVYWYYDKKTQNKDKDSYYVPYDANDKYCNIYNSDNVTGNDIFPLDRHDVSADASSYAENPYTTLESYLQKLLVREVNRSTTTPESGSTARYDYAIDYQNFSTYHLDTTGDELKIDIITYSKSVGDDGSSEHIDSVVQFLEAYIHTLVSTYTQTDENGDPVETQLFDVDRYGAESSTDYCVARNKFLNLVFDCGLPEDPSDPNINSVIDGNEITITDSDGNERKININFTPKEIVDLESFLLKKSNNSDESYSDYINDGITFSDKFNNILNGKAIELLVDEMGEPKYDWIDMTDNANLGNSSVKAQWYTNLFNRMLKGYKTLEDGLASSQEWIKYAFESGLVTMEQVDSSMNWDNIDYKSCANISQATDTSALVAKAEAEYSRAMNDIKQKDQIFDMQLKNLDTEHTAIQTEYDVVKKVLDKNIDRTMKFNQSA